MSLFLAITCAKCGLRADAALVVLSPQPGGYAWPSSARYLALLEGGNHGKWLAAKLPEGWQRAMTTTVAVREFAALCPEHASKTRRPAPTKPCAALDGLPIPEDIVVIGPASTQDCADAQQPGVVWGPNYAAPSAPHRLVGIAIKADAPCALGDVRQVGGPSLLIVNRDVARDGGVPAYPFPPVEFFDLPVGQWVVVGNASHFPETWHGVDWLRHWPRVGGGHVAIDIEWPPPDAIGTYSHALLLEAV